MGLEDIKPFKVKITDGKITEEVEFAPVKHGRWERPVVRGLTCLTALCSVCGYVNNSNDGFKDCPNCGAKMDKEGER